MLNLTLVVAGLKELVIDDLGGTARDASLFFSIEMVAYIIFAPPGDSSPTAGAAAGGS